MKIKYNIHGFDHDFAGWVMEIDDEDLKECVDSGDEIKDVIEECIEFDLKEKIWYEWEEMDE